MNLAGILVISIVIVLFVSVDGQTRPLTTKARETGFTGRTGRTAGRTLATLLSTREARVTGSPDQTRQTTPERKVTTPKQTDAPQQSIAPTRAQTTPLQSVAPTKGAQNTPRQTVSPTQKPQNTPRQSVAPTQGAQITPRNSVAPSAIIQTTNAASTPRVTQSRPRTLSRSTVTAVNIGTVSRGTVTPPPQNLIEGLDPGLVGLFVALGTLVAVVGIGLLLFCCVPCCCPDCCCCCPLGDCSQGCDNGCGNGCAEGCTKGCDGGCGGCDDGCRRGCTGGCCDCEDCEYEETESEGSSIETEEEVIPCEVEKEKPACITILSRLPGRTKPCRPTYTQTYMPVYSTSPSCVTNVGNGRTSCSRNSSIYHNISRYGTIQRRAQNLRAIEGGTLSHCCSQGNQALTPIRTTIPNSCQEGITVLEPAESTVCPDVNIIQPVHVIQQPAPEVNVVQPVHVIQQPAPEVNLVQPVHVIQQPAPEVNVVQPVHVIEQPAPEVNMVQPITLVQQETPEVTFLDPVTVTEPCQYPEPEFVDPIYTTVTDTIPYYDHGGVEYITEEFDDQIITTIPISDGYYEDTSSWPTYTTGQYYSTGVHDPAYSTSPYYWSSPGTADYDEVNVLPSYRYPSFNNAVVVSPSYFGNSSYDPTYAAYRDDIDEYERPYGVRFQL